MRVGRKKKQPTVALSTCEAEYHAINTATKEMIWAIRVLNEAGFEVDYTPNLNSDNQSAIDWSTSEQCPSARAKHIDVQVHFVREKIQDGTIAINYVPSEENDADLLTKALGKQQHETVCKRIGIEHPSEEEC